jgi:hypothetical protein
MNSRVAEVGVYSQFATHFAIGRKIRRAQYSALFQNDVLNHATMALGHDENVRTLKALSFRQQLIVNHIDNFGTGESWGDVERRDLLGNLKNPTTIFTTTLS